jgi:hypothetical protein
MVVGVGLCWRCVLQLRGTYWMTLPVSIFILQKKEVIYRIPYSTRLAEAKII